MRDQPQPTLESALPGATVTLTLRGGTLVLLADLLQGVAGGQLPVRLTLTDGTALAGQLHEVHAAGRHAEHTVTVATGPDAPPQVVPLCGPDGLSNVVAVDLGEELGEDDADAEEFAALAAASTRVAVLGPTVSQQQAGALLLRTARVADAGWSHWQLAAFGARDVTGHGEPDHPTLAGIRSRLNPLPVRLLATGRVGRPHGVSHGWCDWDGTLGGLITTPDELAPEEVADRLEQELGVLGDAFGWLVLDVAVTAETKRWHLHLAGGRVSRTSEPDPELLERFRQQAAARDIGRATGDRGVDDRTGLTRALAGR